MTILYRYEWNEVSGFSGEKYNADEDQEHKRYIIRQQGKLNKYVSFSMLDKLLSGDVMYSKSPGMKKNFLEQLKQTVYLKTEAKKKEYIALKSEADRYIKALEHEEKYTAHFVNLTEKSN